MSGVALRVDGLRRHFGGVTAVDGVTLDVPERTVFGLIGPNGAGKTTLVNLVTGHVTADAGHVWLGERELTRRPVHEIAAAGVARTFQNLRLYRALDARDNVMVGMHARRRGETLSGLLPSPQARRRAAERSDRAMALLRQVGLDADKVARRPAATLPYADQRRLEIARALAVEPRVLVLDEPAAGMNRVEKDRLRDLIAGLVEDSGLTVLLIEHDMRLVMSLCSRIAVLDFGRKIADGSPDEVAADPAVITAYLGTGGTTDDARPTTRRPSGGTARDDRDPVLTVEHLSVAYGAVQAVRDVSLTVQDGELVALIGANGAGKSTILRALSGLVRASGRVQFGPLDVVRSRPPALVAAGLVHVPEGREVLARQSVEENLLLGAAGRGRAGRDEARRDVDACLQRFPILGERRTQPAGLLSGGEQQLLVIARALVARPRLLLLDEPSLGLAPQLTDRIFDLIAEINRSGTTVLLVEQNARRALELADRAYVIDNGEVALSGRSADLLADERVKRLYLGA